jgi:hypothetical protein
MGSLGFLWAQGKGFGYWSDASSTDKIRDLLDCYSLKKWGWVIYRCTYGDDSAWQQFLQQLTDYQTQEVLRRRNNADDLVPSYNWIVIEDPATLDGATKDEVRRRFKKLRTSLVKDEVPDHLEDYKKRRLPSECPRYNFCIHVGSEAVESVLREGVPYNGNSGPTTSHVNLIRADDAWDVPDFDRFDWAQHKAGKQAKKKRRREWRIRSTEKNDDESEDDEYDHREAEIEGCRLYDVGWTKVRADSLIYAYSVLQKVWLWRAFYKRPPQVMEC